MKRTEEDLFGRAVVREGLAPQAQVDECLAFQREIADAGAGQRSLAEILREKGYLDDEGVRRVEEVVRRERAVRSIPGYRIMDRIGQGGMGTVFRARQLSLDRVVAIKVLPRRLASDPTYITRFVSEAKAVARLNHENVIAGIDVGETGGVHYFVMEYVEGKSVDRLMEESGPLSPEQATGIAIQMARALQHAHENGLVHRDVKPQNILLTSEGVAKLCDLGLATVEGVEEPQVRRGRSVGTPYYVAPEQARGDLKVDIRADIYALGASLFHMLTGEPPFPGEGPLVVMSKHLTEEPRDPSTLRKEIPAPLSRLILRCMAKKPEQRPQTPTELLDELERLAPRVAGGGTRGGTRGGGGGRGGGRGRRRGGGGGARNVGRVRAARDARRREVLHLAILILVLVTIAGAAAWFLVGPGQTSGDFRVLSPEEEEEAMRALESAAAFVGQNPDRIDEAIRQCEAVIETWPGGRAAGMAKDLLGDLRQRRGKK